MEEFAFSRPVHSRFFSPFGSNLPYCKESAKLGAEVEKEFDDCAVYAALREV